MFVWCWIAEIKKKHGNDTQTTHASRKHFKIQDVRVFGFIKSHCISVSVSEMKQHSYNVLLMIIWDRDDIILFVSFPLLVGYIPIGQDILKNTCCIAFCIDLIFAELENSEILRVSVVQECHYFQAHLFFFIDSIYICTSYFYTVIVEVNFSALLFSVTSYSEVWWLFYM